MQCYRVGKATRSEREGNCCRAVSDLQGTGIFFPEKKELSTGRSEERSFESQEGEELRLYGEITR